MEYLTDRITIDEKICNGKPETDCGAQPIPLPHR